MKAYSIGDMLRKLVELIGSGELTTRDQSFVRSASEQSNGGADTSKLPDEWVDRIDDLYRRAI